ncbi:alpha/beta hydrolase [Sphingomonas sp. 1P06PA]|uniref:alpha/beta fold hydrolase n=1 Tax=Sphingomonas sp. 1P06PA TaxID=554121 RepID=UPI0039A699F7
MQPAPFDRRAHPAGFMIERWRAPDGWDHRRFSWPQPAGTGVRGSLIVQGGRGDFIEKYLEAIAHFHCRGWAVEGFDWRGQGGSGRTADDLRTIPAMVDDLAAFVAEWQPRTPGPHVLLAHSMGGHVALRLAAERAPAIDALVLSAPMLGLSGGRPPGPVGSAIAGLFCRIGLSARDAWAERGESAFRRVMLTADVDRFSDEGWWKAADPTLALGPPRWSWIAGAYRSIAALMAPGILERVRVPTLLLAAARDRLVDSRAIRRAAARIPGARLIVRDDAAHELLREADGPRTAFLAAIDDFLDERAAPR